MNQTLLLILLLCGGRPRGRRLSREIYQILTSSPYLLVDSAGPPPHITSSTNSTGTLNDLVEDLEDLLRSRESGQTLRLELLLPLLLGLGQQAQAPPAMPAPTPTAPAPAAAPAIDPTTLLALVLLSRPNDLS